MRAVITKEKGIGWNVHI